MRFVRGRADARHLPSRFNFALFRLAAYLRVRRAMPQAGDEILVIDRHQSTFETWAVMLWFLLSATAFGTATWFADWTLPLALLFGAVTTLVVCQLALLLSGLVLWPLWRSITRTTILPYRFNGAVMMGAFLAAAAECATRPAWVRFAGRQALIIAALNVVAAAIVFLLRDSIARLDARAGGAASEQ